MWQLRADARALPLADGCVQCCMTSPPYWGLRDYGTATWNGGDPACDHIAAPHSSLRPERSRATSGTFHGSMSTNNAAAAGTPYRDICGKCGARRVDRQLGLEATPDAYVAAMVDVFSEVWRTLRADGTCFLNLGDSYSANTYGRIRAYEADAFFSLPVDLRRDVFELWRAALGPTLPRYVRDVLPADMEESASRSDEPLRQGLLPAEQNRMAAEDGRAESEASCGNDTNARGAMRLLRGDTSDLSVSGSHQGRRAQGICADGRDEWRVETCDHRGTSEGQVSSAVLELQRRAWTLWNVPTLDVDLARVPREARCFFNATLKPKDLVGIPWMLAFALRADGWYLRSDIIWGKSNPMPESVTDRPTKAHEYIFLLAKSQRYYFDADAVREPQAIGTIERFGNGQAQRKVGKAYHAGRHEALSQELLAGRNIRSVWPIATQPYPGAHFATFPEAIPERCILAGTKPGDLVLDPFSGSGTVGRVAIRLARRAVLCEINPAYLVLADARTTGITYGLPLEAV